MLEVPLTCVTFPAVFSLTAVYQATQPGVAFCRLVLSAVALKTTVFPYIYKPEGKRPLRRPRRRWVDNIRMDLQEVGCGYMDWIGLAQDRDRWRTLVSAVMNLRVP